MIQFYKKYFYQIIVIAFIATILLKIMVDAAISFTQFFSNPESSFHVIFIVYILVFLIAYFSFAYYLISRKEFLFGYAISGLGILTCSQFIGFAYIDNYLGNMFFYQSLTIFTGLKIFIIGYVFYKKAGLFLKLFALSILAGLVVNVIFYISSFDLKYFNYLTDALPHLFLTIFFIQNGDILSDKMKAFFKGERIS